MLPKQPTIASAQVIENPKSWPIQPPGQTQLDVLRQHLAHRLQEFSRERRLALDRQNSEDMDTANHEVNDQTPDSALYHGHLNKSFAAWRGLPESKQRETWHLEALRAFAREQQDHEETKAKMSKQEADIAHLRLQLNRLNDCQQPREFLMSPPGRMQVSREAAYVVSNKSSELPLDSEALIAKWTARVQSNSSFQRSLPAPPEQSESSEPMNGVEIYNSEAHNTNGGNASTVHGEDDSEDAAGEDDDDLAQQTGPRAPEAPINRAVLDPNLRDSDSDLLMDIGESDAADIQRAQAMLDTMARERDRERKIIR